MHDDEVYAYAKLIQAPVDLVLETRRLGRLPVTTFAAGGIATPADVILMVRLVHTLLRLNLRLISLFTDGNGM